MRHITVLHLDPPFPLACPFGFQEWEGGDLICAFAPVVPGRLSQVLETKMAMFVRTKVLLQIHIIDMLVQLPVAKPKSHRTSYVS